jgi:transcriptional regulator with XRE-family HTH domain
MVTTQQIKAARALLNWKQSDLADISGVSLPAIAKIELGQGNPRQKTILALQQAFETCGIEFLGDHGVNQKQEKFLIDVYHDKEGVYRMWCDIENVFADGKGGEVLLSSLDERLFLKFFSKEMGLVLQRRAALNIVTRGLISETDDFLVMPVEWYRSVPKVLFTQVPYFIYGDRMGILDLSKSPRLILIQNKHLTDAFRQQFEYNWSVGKKVDPKKAIQWKLEVNQDMEKKVFKY